MRRMSSFSRSLTFPTTWAKVGAILRTTGTGEIRPRVKSAASPKESLMRILLLWLLVPVSLVAQQPAGRGGAQQPAGRGGGPAPTYKNLKLLAATSDVPFIMRSFNEALGVQCIYCHTEGDFAADGNPKKEMARRMIGMVRIIDTSFPSSNGVFPDGYHEVDCLTCHRGSVKPETVAPTKFYNRGNALGDGPFPERPGVSLQVLPPNTPVHGPDSLMSEFRDALGVDRASWQWGRH